METSLPITERLQPILDEMIEGCQIIDPSYRYLYVNRTVCVQGHRTREQLLGKTMMSTYPGIQETEMFSQLRQCMEKREQGRMENEFTYPSGETSWFELHMEPIAEGVLIFSFDITERKRIEMDIRQEREKFQKILENLEDIVHIMDGKGAIFYVTPSVERVLGYTPDEFLSTGIGRYLHPDDLERSRDLLHSILSHPGKTFQAIEERVLRKDGEYRTMEVVAINLLDNPAVSGIVVTSRDITKEREVDRAKTEFVSLASHQLRTPLGIAKWYLEAIREEPYVKQAPEPVPTYLEEVYRNNRRVLSVVRDLLSVSRIDQNHIKDTPHLVDLAALVTELTSEMRILANQKDIRLRLFVRPPRDYRLHIDPLRLYEAIENLVSNALEYTPAGGSVTVSLGRADEDRILIKVKDTGIGISKADQAQLFTKFFRSEKGAMNNTEGSGLGLYVARSYVEDWGGSLAVRSSLGKGSLFIITLPAVIRRQRQREGKP